MIIPTSAGGPTDGVGRIIASAIGEALQQTVVVENLPGAGGTVGMGRLARAQPDGYAIGFWHIAHATAPAMYPNLAYNVIDDFEHVGRIVDVPMTIVVRSDLPVSTTGELLGWMRNQQDKATYGHGGVGSAAHLCMLMLMRHAGVTMTGVPYRGTGPAMTDLIGKRIDLLCDGTPATTGLIADGKIKGIAVTTSARASSLPDLPTLAEGGLAGFDVNGWHGLWAPKGLAGDVRQRLHEAVQKSLQDPRVRERFRMLHSDPVRLELATSAALRSHLQAEVDKWTPLIRDAGVKGN
jgi:tripartite-type tricarboxylate transporter receptor subunit TctC